jgi:hypothetical protein
MADDSVVFALNINDISSHVPVVVDAKQHRTGRTRHVRLVEDAADAHKSMVCIAVIPKGAGNRAGVVNTVSEGKLCLWIIDGGVNRFTQQKPVWVAPES